jgi:Cys-tRNA(Pro)/Cys-tRNA(Cys) deacylase
MRFLDARRIPYTATTYHDAGRFHRAEEAAAMLGVPLSAMYKTLVVLAEAPRRKPIIVMIPSDSEVDLKLLAASLGRKRLRMATQREAEDLTGMQAGGISVLGLKRLASFEILIDERARGLEVIHISAGERGIEIALATHDLIGGCRRKIRTGDPAVHLIAHAFALRCSSTPLRSAGSGDSNSTSRPPRGIWKANFQAWRNCRPRRFEGRP